jgi:Zn-finger nucleic acid-binding protein
MNCPNCGAPMTPHTSRRTWQCGHCATTLRMDPGPVDGVRLLENNASSRYECPVCHRALVAATMDDRHQVDTCLECKGLLMPLSLFGTTIIAKRRTTATSLSPTVQGGAIELDRSISCPSCGHRMMTDWYYGPGHVVIDRCESCDLVWLDGGELQRVIEAPGPDRTA